jgi:hypothetical protein
MSLIKEDFYRCECGSAHFLDCTEYVIDNREPEQLRMEDYDRIRPVIRRSIIKYKCAACGKELIRGGAY